MENKSLIIGNRRIFSLGFFGLGISNTALAEYVRKNYGEVRLILRSDVSVTPPEGLFDRVYLKENSLREVLEDAIILSPSVRRDRAELQELSARGVLISTETEFFFERYEGDCFAISGSDGKSTTTTITALMLKERYPAAGAVGNIGRPLTEGLHLPAVAAELSSFQLMDVYPVTKRATVTNVTENHLNWHKDYGEYINAKKNLYKNTREPVFGCDCPVVKEMLPSGGAFALYSASLSHKELTELCAAEVYVTLEGGYITANKERLIDLNTVRLMGEHNIKNLMAATALTFGLVSSSHISEVAGSFPGLSHRNEFIGCYGGVDYYNSSIDSSPLRTATTLKSHRSGITLILGGKSKGLDYRLLVPEINKKVSLLIITGENQEEILTALTADGGITGDVRTVCRDTLAEGIRTASELTPTGGQVLLSPASTSFDAFRNFEERGETFIKTVKEIFSK